MLNYYMCISHIQASKFGMHVSYCTKPKSIFSFYESKKCEKCIVAGLMIIALFTLYYNINGGNNNSFTSVI